MTWTDYEHDPFQVAAEQYIWWRNSGFKIWEMVEAIGGNHGKPKSMTGDDMVYWLAQIWDGG